MGQGMRYCEFTYVLFDTKLMLNKVAIIFSPTTGKKERQTSIIKQREKLQNQFIKCQNAKICNVHC